MKGPLSRFALNQLRYARAGWRTDRSPDRTVLTDEILPAFAAGCGSILWIGVRRYTASYPARLERDGAVCWTLDIDPVVRRWGHPARHLTADLLDAAETLQGLRFEAVLCNGVFGYGIDTPQAQRTALAALGGLLPAGGWLMLGWNTHRLQDPSGAIAQSGLFEPAAFGRLAERIAVPGTTHVFDLLRRTPATVEAGATPAYCAAS